MSAPDSRTSSRLDVVVEVRVRQGWARDTLKVGQTITVSGWRARLEPNLGAAREVTFADGRKMAVGPPAGTGGQ